MHVRSNNFTQKCSAHDICVSFPQTRLYKLLSQDCFLKYSAGMLLEFWRNTKLIGLSQYGSFFSSHLFDYHQTEKLIYQLFRQLQKPLSFCCRFPNLCVAVLTRDSVQQVVFCIQKVWEAQLLDCVYQNTRARTKITSRVLRFPVGAIFAHPVSRSLYYP